jgi:hypothetical protein
LKNPLCCATLAGARFACRSPVVSQASCVPRPRSPSGSLPAWGRFLEHAALQCGFCTPGLLVAARALLDRNPNPTETEARYWLAGNLCRCTGYDKVIRAVLDAVRTTSRYQTWRRRVARSGPGARAGILRRLSSS